MSRRNPFCSKGTNESNMAPEANSPCSSSKGSPSPTILKKIPFDARYSFVDITRPYRLDGLPARHSPSYPGLNRRIHPLPRVAGCYVAPASAESVLLGFYAAGGERRLSVQVSRIARTCPSATTSSRLTRSDLSLPAAGAATG